MFDVDDNGVPNPYRQLTRNEFEKLATSGLWGDLKSQFGWSFKYVIDKSTKTDRNVYIKPAYRGMPKKHFTAQNLHISYFLSVDEVASYLRKLLFPGDGVDVIPVLQIPPELTPPKLRSLCRAGTYTSQTSGLCPGYAQVNLCILPKEYAFDFLLFCQRNPKPCPLIECLEGFAYRGMNML